jgi:hypothetical protein
MDDFFRGKLINFTAFICDTIGEDHEWYPKFKTLPEQSDGFCRDVLTRLVVQMDGDLIQDEKAQLIIDANLHSYFSIKYTSFPIETRAKFTRYVMLFRDIFKAS